MKKKEIICECCGKKNEENKIVKIKSKNKKIFILCKNCLDKIYDKVYFKEIQKYSSNEINFIGYEISEERYKKIKRLKEQFEKKYELDIKKEFKTPSDIKKKLDEYVIGQEEAKKVLSVAAFNHIRRISNPESKMVKSNVFMIGPTGTGKTYLSQKLSEIINVPMITFDATTLTGTGWRGNEIRDIVEALMIKSGLDPKKCEKAIIHIDEIDKIATVDTDQRDINGTSVQQMLLKFIEGIEMQWGSDKINTKNILFIVSGVFEKLHKK